MVMKSAAALAILVLVSTGILAMPYISQVEAEETVALAKGDRLDIRSECTDQVWPNFTPSCLKGGPAAAAVRLVR
jgi:hypothetical protein